MNTNFNERGRNGLSCRHCLQIHNKNVIKYLSSFQNEEYVGTEPWSASEVFDEDGVVTNKTDVFALGCVVYEMLALEAPVSEFQVLSEWFELSSYQYEAR